MAVLMVKYTFWSVLGMLFVALGLFGVFLPLLPTTPFMLLAAYCFSKGSPRLHNWLLAHPIFGELIINWQQYGVIAKRAKWFASIAMLFCMLGIQFLTIHLGLKIVVFIIMVFVMGFILSRPSSKK